MHQKSSKKAKSPLKNDDFDEKKFVENSVKKVEEKSKKHKKSSKRNKSAVIFTTTGICGIVGGIACALVGLLMPKEVLPNLAFPKIPSAVKDNNIYSNLTGEVVAADVVNAPTFCVQTPNGMDGARPQAGLNQAGVVFEAIAEAGITRFAAIYQNPTSAVIGPIRSLRLYYLQWDTPFDCTIVHAGGADDAIAAVKTGGYKDLSENYTYMYRGTAGSRLWNNLFTTASYLKQMNNDWGYGESKVNGFSRMTPDESLRTRVDTLAGGRLLITEEANGDTSAMTPKTTAISVNFGGLANFNPRYSYNAETNTYARSYESGAKHEVYICPDENLGEVNPESTCTLSQMAPSVVATIVVNERKAADNYHEDITTVGTGEACVFQNGYAIPGSWSKSTVADQIKFFDDSGTEIRLAPGQTFIEAVPTYGSVEYN